MAGEGGEREGRPGRTVERDGRRPATADDARVRARAAMRAGGGRTGAEAAAREEAGRTGEERRRGEEEETR